MDRPTKNDPCAIRSLTVQASGSQGSAGSQLKVQAHYGVTVVGRFDDGERVFFDVFGAGEHGGDAEGGL